MLYNKQICIANILLEWRYRMVGCALWEVEEALEWVIMINALAPLMHYSVRALFNHTPSCLFKFHNSHPMKN